MNELFNHIESPEFGVLLNIASGFKTVLGILGNHVTVLKLLAKMDQDWRNQVSVEHRISFLMAAESQEDLGILALQKKEHRYDSAIATYLYLLSKCNMALAYNTCHSAFQHPAYFWTAEVSKYIKGQK